jgi:hypothetical protein
MLYQGKGVILAGQQRTTGDSWKPLCGSPEQEHLGVTYRQHMGNGQVFISASHDGLKMVFGK